MQFVRSLLINDDIEAIIQRGEERTVELNSKYEGLTFEDLSNFKSEASVQQWEGEDFRGVLFPYIFWSPNRLTCIFNSNVKHCTLTRWRFQNESAS